MALKIFNTMSRRKEEFVPLKPHFVRMYTCGLTVYDYMHIGHARTYCFWDVLRRWLRHSGYQVVSVINYTDIEDKIIARANETGEDVSSLSRKFIAAFDDDIRWLGIEPWTITCRATDFVPQMIEMVKALVDKGFGYVVEGDVYFSVEKFRGYGKLSGHNLDDLIAGSRVEVDERKRNPADFALWKSAKEGEPFWDSPWGKGRPGWHIECSVMSMNYLGDTLDIHGGAVDNMFPHHENEIAQSESYTGKPFSKYWMHPEHLLMEGTKMSKSLGNFLTVHDLKEQSVDPRAVRLYFLMNHYKTQMNFSDEGLAAAQASLERIQNFYDLLDERMVALKQQLIEDKSIPLDDHLAEALIQAAEDQPRPDNALQESADLRVKFKTAMDDDLNTTAALGAVFELIKNLNTDPAGMIPTVLSALVFQLAVNNRLNLLGLGTFEGKSPALRRFENLSRLASIVQRYWPEGVEVTTQVTEHHARASEQVLAAFVEPEIQKRNDARARKDFKEADAIRDRLADMGVILEDTPSGTRWHVKPGSGAE